jgi:hypothetical protein
LHKIFPERLENMELINKFTRYYGNTVIIKTTILSKINFSHTITIVHKILSDILLEREGSKIVLINSLLNLPHILNSLDMDSELKNPTLGECRDTASKM